MLEARTTVEGLHGSYLCEEKQGLKLDPAP
jgi:hypothetical protein